MFHHVLRREVHKRTHSRTEPTPHRLPSPAPLDCLKQPLFPFAMLCLDSCLACTAVYSGDHEIITDPFGRHKACEKGRGSEASRAFGYSVLRTRI